MKVIIDVFYNDEESHHGDSNIPCPVGKNWTAGVLFNNWTDSEKDVIGVITQETGIDYPYVPGEFYKRELPCIQKLLTKLDLKDVDTIVVDGLYMLWDGKPGPGKRLHDWLKSEGYDHINVIGIVKTKPRDAELYATPVVRGEGATNPIWVNGSLDCDYTELIKSMDGEHRIPTLVKMVDSYSRGIEYQKF